jgi:hypothetical protein
MEYCQRLPFKTFGADAAVFIANDTAFNPADGRLWVSVGPSLMGESEGGKRHQIKPD